MISIRQDITILSLLSASRFGASYGQLYGEYFEDFSGDFSGDSSGESSFGRPFKNKTSHSQVTARVFGGFQDTEGLAPYQVALRKYRDCNLFHQNVNHFCAGTLISENWGVSAAHCLKNYKYDYKPVWDKAKCKEMGESCHETRIFSASGESRYCTKSKKGSNNGMLPVRPVLQFKKHEHFDSDSFVHDIAVFEMKAWKDFPSKKKAKLRKFRVNTLIQPIKLAVNEVNENIEVAATGWGRVDANKITSRKLRRAHVKISDHDNCITSFKDSKPITDHHICALGEELQDACEGDSGGPIVGNIGQSSPYTLANGPQKFYDIPSVLETPLNGSSKGDTVRTNFLANLRLIGVVSFGDPKLCNKDSEEENSRKNSRSKSLNPPGVYTKVSKYICWIAKSTKLSHYDLTGYDSSYFKCDTSTTTSTVTSTLYTESTVSSTLYTESIATSTAITCQNYEHQMGNSCIQNTCLCGKGKPATKTCFKNGSRKCVKCNKNFKLVRNRCRQRKPINRRKCKKHQHLKNNKCIDNKCHCGNGEAVDKTCYKNGMVKCKCCNPGYYLKHDKCRPCLTGKSRLCERTYSHHRCENNTFGLRENIRKPQNTFGLFPSIQRERMQRQNNPKVTDKLIDLIFE